MAENLTQYRAYQPLLAALQHHGLAKESISQVLNTVAAIVAEALQSGGQGLGKVQQLPGSATTQLRDLQAADAVLQGVSLIIPRGKFDVGFFADSMQVSNKQTSAAIPYSSIHHVLVIDAIPKQPSTTNLVLVMKSGHPVQQGKNQLDMVVVQTKDEPALSLPAPAACQHLGDTLVGPAAVVLSQLLASYIEEIQDDTFLTAESSVFCSSTGDLMIAANRGAAPGWLVPLSAGLCYIGKPGRFLASSSISKVLFHRTGGGSSTFDITIKQLPGAAGHGVKPLELGQIDAAELSRLQGYLQAHHIRIGTDDDDEDDGAEAAAVAAAASAPVNGTAAAADGDDDDDEEDDDYDPEAADSDAEQQPGKKQKRSHIAAAATDDDNDIDDSDSEEAEDDDEGSDDSSDVSLIDSDAMDEDDEEQ